MTEERAQRLREALRGIDLSRAEGRLGIGVILGEIERAAPQAILQSAARVQLRSLGLRVGDDAAGPDGAGSQGAGSGVAGRDSRAS